MDSQSYADFNRCNIAVCVGSIGVEHGMYLESKALMVSKKTLVRSIIVTNIGPYDYK